MKKAEEALGKLVVGGLEVAGWDVYQEVDACRGRADIVAVKGKLLAVFELKRGPSLELLQQCWRWKHYAHLIVAATWPTKSFAFADLAKEFGIGWLKVHPDRGWGGGLADRLEVWPQPVFTRAKFADKLADKLSEGQKTHAAAGSARGGYWAPWRDTAADLKRVVLENPKGILLVEAVKQIKHHYGSDPAGRRGCQFLLSKNLVPGVRLEKQGSRLVLLPK